MNATTAPATSAIIVGVDLVVMEACGLAHHWARWLNGLGIEVKLPPAAYVRACVRRNKTGAADAVALLEAARCAAIVPVRVKSVEQQALQGLPRTRSLWMSTRTARIDALRGSCREFGANIAQGSRHGVEQISRVLADPHAPVPTLIRGAMSLLVEEIRLLEVRIAPLERELTALARHSPACTTLLSVPGVGLLTATAMVAATSGEVSHFRDVRHFASCFGLTPRGAFVRRHPSSRPNLQTRRPLPAHAPQPWRARCCAPPVQLRTPARPLIRCTSGRSRFRLARTTTRQPARPPTSWQGSATRRCVMADRTVSRG
jgi:transposase